MLGARRKGKSIYHFETVANAVDRIVVCPEISGVQRVQSQGLRKVSSEERHLKTKHINGSD